MAVVVAKPLGYRRAVAGVLPLALVRLRPVPA